MKKKIHINDLLDRQITSVKSGSELLYLYYLSKYAEELLEKKLSFKGITIPKTIRMKNKLFSYLYLKNKFDFVKDNKIKNESTKKIDTSRFGRNVFDKDLSEIVFEKQTDKVWVYNYYTDKSKNIILNRFDRSAGYVNLHAYMVVLYYKDGKETPLLKLINKSHRQEPEEYVDLLILERHGNHLLREKIEIVFSEKVFVNPLREADVVYKRQLGFMLQKSDIKQKQEYMKKNFEVGDVVLYYQVENYGKNNKIRDLEHCYPGVIREISEYYFELEYYPIIQTLLTRVNQFEEFKKTNRLEKKEFSEEEYKKFITNKEKLEYISTGIDLLTYKEDFFIHTLFNNFFEKFEQVIVDKDGKIRKVMLNTIETVYAVFEDRNIEYNKEKFLKKYFRNEKPIYDKLKGR
jgi:hypothetical protein